MTDHITNPSRGGRHHHHYYHQTSLIIIYVNKYKVVIVIISATSFHYSHNHQYLQQHRRVTPSHPPTCIFTMIAITIIVARSLSIILFASSWSHIFSSQPTITESLSSCKLKPNHCSLTLLGIYWFRKFITENILSNNRELGINRVSNIYRQSGNMRQFDNYTLPLSHKLRNKLTKILNGNIIKLLHVNKSSSNILSKISLIQDLFDC